MDNENVNTILPSNDDITSKVELVGEEETGDDGEKVNELVQLQQELEKQNEEVRNNYERYLRALAEADNIKKRAQRDREEYLKYANAALLKKVLPVVDDLERAIKLSNQSQDFGGLYQGVAMIASSLNEILKGEGVEAIDCLGKPFDPQFHQPLTVEENDQYEENTVIEELQKGYIMRGRVIRPSLVKVSK